MALEDLYPQVSAAIEQVQAFEDQGAHFAASAMHRTISVLEEEIANELPASTSQGQIARCGAVRSAFLGNRFVRTRALASRYLADDALPEADRAEIERYAGLADRAISHYGASAP